MFQKMLQGGSGGSDGTKAIADTLSFPGYNVDSDFINCGFRPSKVIIYKLGTAGEVNDLIIIYESNQTVASYGFRGSHYSNTESQIKIEDKGFKLNQKISSNSSMVGLNVNYIAVE